MEGLEAVLRMETNARNLLFETCTQAAFLQDSRILTG